MSPNRKVLLGLIFGGAAIGVLEGLLRFFLPADALLYEWEKSDGALAMAGPRLIPKPGRWNTRRDGTYVWETVVNDDTLREDGPVAAAPQTGEKRLLALGDSWIFGISLTQGRTLPDQLEDQLEAAGWATHVDVINAGVPSFSAFDVLWRWHELRDKFQIDGVLIGEPHNAGHNRARSAEREAWYQAMQVSAPSGFRVYRLLRRGFDQFRQAQYAVPPTGLNADLAAADLETLVRDIRARGIPVYFLLLPVEMNQSISGPPIVGPLGGRMRAAGAITGGHALSDRECWGFDDPGHPSELGAGALATVATAMVTSGVSQVDVRKAPSCGTSPSETRGK